MGDNLLLDGEHIATNTNSNHFMYNVNKYLFYKFIFNNDYDLRVEYKKKKDSIDSLFLRCIDGKLDMLILKLDEEIIDIDVVLYYQNILQKKVKSQIQTQQESNHEVVSTFCKERLDKEIESWVFKDQSEEVFMLLHQLEIKLLNYNQREIDQYNLLNETKTTLVNAHTRQSSYFSSKDFKAICLLEEQYTRKEDVRHFIKNFYYLLRYLNSSFGKLKLIPTPHAPILLLDLLQIDYLNKWEVERVYKKLNANNCLEMQEYKKLKLKAHEKKMVECLDLLKEIITEYPKRIEINETKTHGKFSTGPKKKVEMFLLSCKRSVDCQPLIQKLAKETK